MYNPCLWVDLLFLTIENKQGKFYPYFTNP
jgi:hypothetical protein